MKEDSIIISNIGKSFPIQLNEIILKEDYYKKWNVYGLNNFVCIVRNGEQINNSLYRVGGLKEIPINKNIELDYFMLLKYVESFYDDSIVKDKSKKRHLEGRWCIIDRNGIEKVVFKPFSNVYLAGGILYKLDSHLYNIETGEKICSCSSSISSNEFIFVDNQFDKDESRRGVLKVCKKTGKFEVYK